MSSRNTNRKEADDRRPGVHFVAPYFRNPVHRIRVDLVGAGGSGSQMLSALARINHALVALGRTGLFVRVWDPDTVEDPNVGRQLFSPAEVGLNKAVALAGRFNRFYGTDWEGYPQKYDASGLVAPNILITCVDNLQTRKETASLLSRKAGAAEFTTYYWLDLGNARKTGQAILGSREIVQPYLKKVRTVGKLPLFSEEFDISAIDEKESGPSCSMAEALASQDLFINSSLVQLSASLLWSLLRENQVRYRGFYLNLESLGCVPIEL